MNGNGNANGRGRGAYQPQQEVEVIDLDDDRKRSQVSSSELWLKEEYKGKARIGICVRDLTVQTQEATLLQQIQMEVRPGKLAAILGRSGSGKTTLLDCITGRRPAVQGSVVWYAEARSSTDAPPTDDEDDERRMQRIASEEIKGMEEATFAYVPQTSVMHGHQTVAETLETAAALKLPDWSDSRRSAWVTQLIGLLDLTACANRRVGSDVPLLGSVAPRTGAASSSASSAMTRLSGGQRKRLSIGVELVALPNVLVLDEPTSGLDSHCADSVIALLWTLSHAGCTVLMTLHQPSSRSFHRLSYITVLCSARLVYSGEVSGLESFLSSHTDHPWRTRQVSSDDHGLHLQPLGASPRSMCGNHIPLHEHLLDILQLSNVQKLATAFAHSSGPYLCDQAVHIERQVDLHAMMQQHHPQSGTGGGCWRPFVTLLRRSARGQWRDPGVFGTRLVAFAGLCLLIGAMARGLVDMTIDERVAVHFFTSSVLLSLTIACMPVLLQESAVYEQESSNGHYGPLPHVLVGAIGSLPYLALISFVCTAVVFATLPDARGFWVYWLALGLTLTSAESLMALVCAVCGSNAKALVLGGMVMCMNVVLCGFFITPPRLHPLWQLLQHLVVTKYHFGLILFLDLHERSFHASPLSCPTSHLAMTNATAALARCVVEGDAVLRVYDAAHLSIWATLGILAGIALGCRLLEWICLVARRMHCSTSSCSSSDSQDSQHILVASDEY